MRLLIAPLIITPGLALAESKVGISKVNTFGFKFNL